MKNKIYTLYASVVELADVHLLRHIIKEYCIMRAGMVEFGRHRGLLTYQTLK
jgi:hypothetical protein